jgi:hypothetical protein
MNRRSVKSMRELQVLDAEMGLKSKPLHFWAKAQKLEVVNSAGSSCLVELEENVIDPEVRL